jgi:hypothetical protein
MFDFALNRASNPLSQSEGKRKIRPRNITIPPETHFHIDSGILIKRVLTFKSKVKIITDTPRDKMIVKAFFLFNVPIPPFESEPPIITGRSGKIHGASTVRTPAINEMKSKSIVLVNLFYIPKYKSK